MFQSLSRDSGRLNRRRFRRGIGALLVSIPQSGFGAFELATLWRMKPSDLVSIPQSGFGAFERLPVRDYSREQIKVSIPQSGFGAFEHELHANPPGQ